MTPSTMITLRGLPSARWVSAMSAMVPPSPLLSARTRISTYFSVTMMISDQRISDSTPNTAGSVASGLWPLAASVASRNA